MITVSYNKDENIIYIDRSGDITLQDILSNIKKLDSNFINLEELNIIEDLRNSNSKYGEEDYPIIIDEIKKSIANFNLVKSAIIVASPHETVLGFLYEEISRNVDKYYFKTFSTMDAAKRWLA